MRTIKSPQYTQKKAKTRSITYRLPEKVVDELETEAMQKNISQNVLVKQILEKYEDAESYYYDLITNMITFDVPIWIEFTSPIVPTG